MAIPWVTTVARLVLGGVLIVAGALKIGNPADSVVAVKAYQLLPDSIAVPVGYALPILEIVVGVLLVVGLLTRVAAVVAGLLMFAFVFGIAWAWANGLRIDCGCFGGGGQLGAGQEPTYLLDILRDFGLVLLGAWTVRFPPGRLALDGALGLGGDTDDEGADD
ncbi:DoxX family membrane protein [Nonomuraea sp. K274]|uniref:DoxX family membrane protein n=1 Tax=Nonomuraea cypriaca TaxID=1187855 RepID=A0A931AEI4_9ACTN|nr:MauE/DoxX family redox-associated membrane protein [Nonomuraea cypriaca]MBF8188729.1 DoxX family membrane protein [Nonomuraea cypriaca]